MGNFSFMVYIDLTLLQELLFYVDSGSQSGKLSKLVLRPHQ